MNTQINIFTLKAGQEITVETWQGTFNTTFKSYREITVRTRTPSFEIHTEMGIVYAGAKGEPVHYNDYTSKIVSA